AGLLDSAKGFVWTKFPNGVCVFLSPQAARSEAALRKLVKQLDKLSVPRIFKAAGLPKSRQALWARPAQVRRAKRALRSEMQRRFPDDVRALIPYDAAELADQLSRRL